MINWTRAGVEVELERRAGVPIPPGAEGIVEKMLSLHAERPEADFDELNKLLLARGERTLASGTRLQALAQELAQAAAALGPNATLDDLCAEGAERREYFEPLVREFTFLTIYTFGKQ